MSSMCYPPVVVVLMLFDPLLCTLHRLSHLPFHAPVLHLPSSMWVGSMRSPLRISANEGLGTVAENNPLTGYEPNSIDNYHISETTDIFIQESSSDSRPSNLHDLEIDDYTIGRGLSSPLVREREDSASRRQGYHSLDESLLSSQSLSVGHARTGRPVEELSSLISNVRENHVATQKMRNSGFFWNDKKSKISLIIEQRFKNTSSGPIMKEEVFESWMK